MQRSVTDIRRSRKGRPRVSASSGASGAALVHEVAKGCGFVIVMFRAFAALGADSGAPVASCGALYSIVNNAGKVDAGGFMATDCGSWRFSCRYRLPLQKKKVYEAFRCVKSCTCGAGLNNHSPPRIHFNTPLRGAPGTRRRAKARQETKPFPSAQTGSHSVLPSRLVSRRLPFASLASLAVNAY